MTKIKFCGFTRTDDVRRAVGLGVDFLGLNFVGESPRYVSLSQARELVAAAREEANHVPDSLAKLVGVFAAAVPHFVREIATACDLDLVQLHLDDQARIGGYLASMDRPVILAIRPRPGQPLPISPEAAPWAYLVDAYDPARLGGTGRQADWRAARDLAGSESVFLAGGLRPSNVGAAIAEVRPYAVDVASGIEESPGNKDHSLMQQFVDEVRSADSNGVANDSR